MDGVPLDYPRFSSDSELASTGGLTDCVSPGHQIERDEKTQPALGDVSTGTELGLCEVQPAADIGRESSSAGRRGPGMNPSCQTAPSRVPVPVPMASFVRKKGRKSGSRILTRCPSSAGLKQRFIRAGGRGIYRSPTIRQWPPGTHTHPILLSSEAAAERSSREQRAQGMSTPPAWPRASTTYYVGR
ncbi:hypothetical protein LZ30DRAFT_170592 [Colletotrichum cereale]|nr:hypothetical protein LZ30DRAFT_170592 [Colletotrichum cereale]